MQIIGSGEFNLDGLTEIKATSSYWGLEQDVRKCQNKETFYNCTTRHYIKTLIEECECLPFNIRLSRKVSMLIARKRQVKGSKEIKQEAGGETP